MYVQTYPDMYKSLQSSYKSDPDFSSNYGVLLR